MDTRKLWFALLSLLLPGSYGEDDVCRNFSRMSYERAGDVTITGIFDSTFGENCSHISEFGVEEMAAALWTITALERSKYLPGISIGLTMFDGCSNHKLAKEAFAEAVLYDSCQEWNKSTVGILASSDMKDKLFNEKLNRTVTGLGPILNFDRMLDIVAELLTNLRWTTVNRVIADSHDTLQAFSQRMSDEGICVYDEVLALDNYAVNNEILTPRDIAEEELVSNYLPVIVVLSKSESISIVFEKLTPEMRKLPAKWLLIPIDSVLRMPNVSLPENVYTVLPSVEKQGSLIQFLKNEEIQKDLMNHREATRSPLFPRVAVGILELLKPLKRIQNEHCPGSGTPCPALQKHLAQLHEHKVALQGPEYIEVTPESVLNALNVLNIDPSDSEAFLYIASRWKEGERTEDAAIIQILDVRLRKVKPVLLLVNERLFDETEADPSRRKRSSDRKIYKLSVGDLEKIRRDSKESNTEDMRTTSQLDDGDIFDKHPCADILTRQDINLTKPCGMCQNFIKFHVHAFQSSTDRIEQPSVLPKWAWRDHTWVAINASVASIGIICTLSVMAFIAFRVVKGDNLEGNPFFSFIILLSIISLYISTLPFSVVEQNIMDLIIHPLMLCRLRFVLPPISYTVLFSVILSRSSMLIFVERDGGIINHVNGCLQSVLCFFMCSVQIALTIQFWIYYESIINTYDDEVCGLVHNSNEFIFLMAYSIFLLILLSCAAPFTARSKRNYREGSFFGIATVLVVLVWAVWLTFYYILPPEDKDAAVTFGLTGTSTTVLLSVFIPRTYLMTTAIVRDKITSSLPSLAYVNSSTISDLNYRSNQTLYDSVTVKCRNPKLNISNARIYTVQVSTSAPVSPSISGNGFSAGADSADYILNRRKTFIEVSRAESPENTYESCESPDMTAKITKF